MPRKTVDALADKILRLTLQGVPADQIAKQVKCRKAYVYVCLYRKGYAILRLNPLTDAQHRWLGNQARASNVSLDVMARAMLVDAIAEAMEKEKTK